MRVPRLGALHTCLLALVLVGLARPSHAFYPQLPSRQPYRKSGDAYRNQQTQVLLVNTISRWQLHRHYLQNVFTPPTPMMQDYPKNTNFTLQLGKAMDTLRVDIPLSFEKEPDFSLYTQDLEFRDQNTVYCKGRNLYKIFYLSLRMCRFFFPMPPVVDIINMRWCEARQCVYVRFQIRIDTISDRLYYDAVSLYKLNHEGLIYEHLIERVIRNDIADRLVAASSMPSRLLVAAPTLPREYDIKRTGSKVSSDVIGKVAGVRAGLCQGMTASPSTFFLRSAEDPIYLTCE